MFLEMANYKPTYTICSKHECRNSYGHKICVDEKVRKVACAKYSTKLMRHDAKYSLMFKDIFKKEIYLRHLLVY